MLELFNIKCTLALQIQFYKKECMYTQNISLFVSQNYNFSCNCLNQIVCLHYLHENYHYHVFEDSESYRNSKRMIALAAKLAF